MKQAHSAYSTVIAIATVFAMLWGAITFVRSEHKEAIAPLAYRVERIEVLAEDIPKLLANQNVILRQLGRMETGPAQPKILRRPVASSTR